MAQKSPATSSLHLSHVSASVAPYASASAALHGGTLLSSPSFAALGSGGQRPRDRDSEQLSAEVQALKESGNDLRQENAFLKTQLQRLVAQLRKKDKQIEQITAMKVTRAAQRSAMHACSCTRINQSGVGCIHSLTHRVLVCFAGSSSCCASRLQLSAVSDAGADSILAGQMRELKSEMTTIAKVTDKCRELEASMARKDEEIRKLKSVTKFTQIKELEVRRWDEARRVAVRLAEEEENRGRVRGSNEIGTAAAGSQPLGSCFDGLYWLLLFVYFRLNRRPILTRRDA